LGYAADDPTPKFTVKLVNPDPVNPPQMPKVDFQPPHAGNGGSGGNSSSDVGSNTGGSALNFVAAVADYIKGPQPNYDQMRRDTKNQKFVECISKYGPQTSAQFYPEETAAYMQKQNEREMAELFKQMTATAPTPTPSPVVSASVVAVVAPTPTPAPVVAAPVVSTPTVLSTTSLVVTSAPAPVIATPMPSPANPSSIIPGLGTAPMLGGLQGSTQLIKPSFPVFNPVKTPTLGELLPPQGYVRTVIATPPPVPNPINPNYTPPSAPGALEVAGATAATVGAWGSIKGAAIAGAGMAKAGAAATVGFLTGPAFATGLVVVGGGLLLGYGLCKLFPPQPVVQQVEKMAVDTIAHRQIHETVHTPTPQPIVQSHSTPAPQPHRNLPANLQPSDNPLKLGKKIYQPGPKAGQGDRPHGYKDQWGHYKEYTPENVAHAIEGVEKGVWHGQNPVTGKHIYTYDCPKTGLQKWAEVDNTGGILNCGINEVPHTVCPQKIELVAPAGFKKPSGKNTGWVDKTLKVGVVGSALTSHNDSFSSLLSREEELLPGEYLYLPPAPRETTVHDLYAERMTKNHYVAMEQKKIEVIQKKMNEGSNL
jgi:hypothetical protein